MAYVNFSKLKVLSTFASPQSMNAWGYIETQPWRKVEQVSTDGVNNMFTLLNAAKASGRTVSGSYDDGTGSLHSLFMN